MASSKKAKPTAAPAVGSLKAFDKAKKSFKNLDPRNGLAAYLEHPDTNPEGRVVEYDDDFVVIRDKFPKARYAPLLLSTWRESQPITAYTSSSSPVIPHITHNILSMSYRRIQSSLLRSRSASPVSSNLQPPNFAVNMGRSVLQTRPIKQLWRRSCLHQILPIQRKDAMPYFHQAVIGCPKLLQAFTLIPQ